MDVHSVQIFAIYLIGYFIVLLIGKLVFFKISKNNYTQLLFEDDYFAGSLTFSTFLLGLSLAFIGCIIGEPRSSLLQELTEIGIYGTLSLLLTFVSILINDKILLREINNAKAIASNNIAVALAVAGSNIATGVILLSCFTGNDTYILSSIVFFFWSQLLFIVAYFVYEWITPYRFKDQIKSNNIAVGLGIFGIKIAIAIILSNATWGNFIAWEVFLEDAFYYGTASILFVVIIRLIFSKLLFTGININKEISEDRNVGTGLIEAVFTISIALVINLLLA